MTKQTAAQILVDPEALTPNMSLAETRSTAQ